MRTSHKLVTSMVVLAGAWLALGLWPKPSDNPAAPATGIAQAADRNAKSDAAPLIVHEWGTFTSFSGSNGVKLEFRPLLENDLPPFVLNRSGNLWLLLGKSTLPAIQRMETPVTYFYTPIERDVSVRVDFPKGLLTEFYPPVKALRPKPDPKLSNVRINTAGLADALPLKDSMLDWGTVHLIPPESLNAQVQDAGLARRIGRHVEQTMVPLVGSSGHYAAARATDSAIVQVRHGPIAFDTAAAEPPKPTDSEIGSPYVVPGDYFEKFLFYRGLGDFDLPVTLTARDNGTFTLANSGADELRSLYLVTVRGDTLQYRRFVKVAPRSTLELTPAAQPSTVNDLADAVVRSLVAEGLYEKEAQAMVNTWRGSWFGEEGTRLFYIVPQRITNELLPLTITPAPDELIRVLVGRMEIMTPTREKQVLDMVQRSAAARTPGTEAEPAPSSPVLKDLLALGRLAEPALVRARHIAGNDAIRREADQLVQELRAAYEQQK
jgi:hypothetical protein